jgi:hydrogenase nickel incorporation protein HypA/HybF
MHEWALAEGVIATALGTAQQEGLSAVAKIVVRIGELQQIEREVFGEALKTAVPPGEPRLRSVVFEILTEPARFECRPCGHRFGLEQALRDLGVDESEAIHFVPELAHAFCGCPRCHSPDFDVVQGRGVWLESIEGA